MPSTRKPRRTGESASRFSVKVERAIAFAIDMRDARSADLPRPADLARQFSRAAARFRAARDKLDDLRRDPALYQFLLTALEAVMPKPAIPGEIVFADDALTSIDAQVIMLIDAADRAAQDAPDFRRLDARCFLVWALASAFHDETGNEPDLPIYDPLAERSRGAFLDYAVPRFFRFDRDLSREGLSMLIRRTIGKDAVTALSGRGAALGQKRARRARSRP